MTGHPEVTSSPVGLVPINALVLTGLVTLRVVGNSETTLIDLVFARSNGTRRAVSRGSSLVCAGNYSDL